MGFLDFDAARYLEPEGRPPAKVANVAKDAGGLATLAGLAALPAELSEGAAKLATMRVPRWTSSDRWRLFVGDVTWLCETGVAADALGQGWTPLDLFGVSTDEQWECLAAWIGGRRDEFNRACILLREMRAERTMLYAVQALTTQRRWHYPQPTPSDARLPWTI
jgi:hypothetical protein